jgi:hypothetical protein
MDGMALVDVPANHANIANGYHVGRMARSGFSRRHADEGRKNRKTIGLNQTDYNCSKKVFSRSIVRDRLMVLLLC